MDRGGKADPFAVLKLQGSVQKTAVAKNTLDPSWLSGPHTWHGVPMGATLIVEVFDKVSERASVFL